MINFQKDFEKKSHSTNMSLPLNANVYFGKVLSVNDDNNTGKIKVFINGIDPPNTKDDGSTLPETYPLLSRIVHIMPKVGEIVLVFYANSLKDKETQLKGNRFWIGPIISNYENIYEDVDGVGVTKNITYDPLQVKSKNNKNKERTIFPIDNEDGLNDVSIIGRNNTEISQSENKIKLRAGKHKKNNPAKPNTQNPAYSILELIDDNTSYSLTVGDEIYLISHKGRFNFKKTITKDDIDELKKNAQSMLYGELTVEYLKILTEAFLSHIHQHPQKQPIKDQTVLALEKKLSEIQNLIANNIKIN
jgi:hypothetical protein